MKAQGGYLPTGGKKSFFSCSYCKRDITQQLRIQCAQCEHFDLCGDCFAAGVSRFPHENTHDYRVVDCIDIPMFTRDWTASEEILMLEGVCRSIVSHLLFRYDVILIWCDLEVQSQLSLSIAIVEHLDIFASFFHCWIFYIESPFQMLWITIDCVDFLETK